MAAVYAVKTTGIYCRPGCPSRRPRPENVVHYASAREAQAAGFRACLRCRPDGLARAAEQAALIERTCRMLESAGTRLSVQQLAVALGVRGAMLQRLFRSAMGVTLAQYARGRRAEQARDALRTSTRITDALYEAGYGSSSRFYAQSSQRLGMTPRQFRRGGADEQLRFAVGECSLGSFLVAASSKGVAAILWGDDAQALLRELQDLFPRATLLGADAAFESLIARVVALMDRPDVPLDLPLDIRGTAFQQRVWQALMRIPPGTTLTYRELAHRLGRPAAVRAVAAACAANRIAVAIPCHRVVRTDGAASGYRWGLALKSALLQREGSPVPHHVDVEG